MENTKGLGRVAREQMDRQVFYRANLDCPVLPELTGLSREEFDERRAQTVSFFTAFWKKAETLAAREGK